MGKYFYDYGNDVVNFYADIVDSNGRLVWSVSYPNYYEDYLTGEMLEDSTIFDDGFMKNPNDINGLENYLKSINILQIDDYLIDSHNQADYAKGGVTPQEGNDVVGKEGVKSILNSNVDLKGGDKELWMNEEGYNNYHRRLLDKNYDERIRLLKEQDKYNEGTKEWDELEKKISENYEQEQNIEIDSKNKRKGLIKSSDEKELIFDELNKKGNTVSRGETNTNEPIKFKPAKNGIVYTSDFNNNELAKDYAFEEVGGKMMPIKRMKGTLGSAEILKDAKILDTTTQEGKDEFEKITGIKIGKNDYAYPFLDGKKEVSDKIRNAGYDIVRTEEKDARYGMTNVGTSLAILNEKVIKPIGVDYSKNKVVNKEGTIYKALNSDKYQQAISEGRMTANDAKKIIESAGLEVPKNILDLADQSQPTPKAEVGKELDITPQEGNDVVGKEAVINSVNPTGKIFTDYNAQERANAKLGENITTLDKTDGGNPDDLVTVYRGVPKGVKEINAGDFVTTNKQLAKDYAGTGEVVKKQVRKGDILDDKTEPLGEEYIYKPTTKAEVGKEGSTTANRLNNIEDRIKRNGVDDITDKDVVGLEAEQLDNKVRYTKEEEKTISDHYKNREELEKIKSDVLKRIINGDDVGKEYGDKIKELSDKIAEQEKNMPSGTKKGRTVEGVQSFSDMVAFEHTEDSNNYKGKIIDIGGTLYAVGMDGKMKPIYWVEYDIETGKYVKAEKPNRAIKYGGNIPKEGSFVAVHGSPSGKIEKFSEDRYGTQWQREELPHERFAGVYMSDNTPFNKGVGAGYGKTHEYEITFTNSISEQKANKLLQKHEQKIDKRLNRKEATKWLKEQGYDMVYRMQEDGTATYIGLDVNKIKPKENTQPTPKAEVGKELDITPQEGNDVYYETYHKTLASALSEAKKFVHNRGYQFSQDTYFPDLTIGGVKYGQTIRTTRDLIEIGGKQRKNTLVLVVYRMDSGTYELTMYLAKSKYASGGTLEKKLKKKLSESLELPMEMAVYVPSTDKANVIISKRDYSIRIEEVESYLSNLFGGYSAVSVDGGYVSDDKGLIQEDVMRVATFGKTEDFESNFEKLLNKVVDWCNKWSQESVGFEFEGDMFYISGNSYFDKEQKK